MQDADIRQKAMIGSAVMDFTDAEECFRHVGAAVDSLIWSDGSETLLSHASELYLKLTSLEHVVGIFKNNVISYIDSCKDSKESIEE